MTTYNQDEWDKALGEFAALLTPVIEAQRRRKPEQEARRLRFRAEREARLAKKREERGGR